MPSLNAFSPLFLAAAFFLSPTGANASGPARDAVKPESTPMAASTETPVFVVMSKATHAGLRSIVHAAQLRRDSIGTELIVGEVRADQLDRISEYVHEQERRCGGYFAFDSLKEADAFVAADRTASAIFAPQAITYTIDNQATVDTWLPQVSDIGIHATIAHLSSYQNRYYASTHGRTAALWIRDTWEAFATGRTDVSADLFEGCSNCSTQPSVILTVQGNELPDEVVVIGGHLDSISNATGGNERLAPGADDDASGIATITEVIRVAMASGWKPKRTVKFMGYAAEEVGLLGSKAIAQRFRADNVNVVGVLQLDMTNYNNGSPVDMRIVTDFSNATLQNFMAALFDEYLLPRGLTRAAYTCGYGCSDHASWTGAGFPSAMMFEAGNANGVYFPYIHTVNDTLANMGDSAANSAKFAKFALAFLGELAKTHDDDAPGNVAPVAGFSFDVDGMTVQFSDASTDRDGGIASRLWQLGEGSTSTLTNPTRRYARVGSHSVTLTVTDDGGLSDSKTLLVAVSNNTVPLENSAPTQGLAGLEGSSQMFTLEVPEGARNLTFSLTGESSEDADLRIDFAGQTICESQGSTASETCRIANAPAPGTYTAIVYAHSDLTGFTLIGSYTPLEDDLIFQHSFDD